MEINNNRGKIILGAILLVIIAFAIGWVANQKYSQSKEVAYSEMGQMILKDGTYVLTGKNPSNNEITYQGTIEIARTGDIYDLVWRIGDQMQQTQKGVGIMNGNILSVGYIDITNGEIRDAGAVSYFVVSNEIMDGQWVSAFGGTTGEEHLIWSGPLTPTTTQ